MPQRVKSHFVLYQFMLRRLKQLKPVEFRQVAAMY